MPQPRRTLLWIFIALLLGGIALGYSYSRFTAQRDRARARDAQATQAARLADRIQAQRGAAACAPNERVAETRMRAAIRQAAKRAALPEQTIRTIQPQGGYRVEGTPYQRQTMRLALQSVTLKQAATFLHGVQSRAAGLRIHRLRLSRRDADDSTSSPPWTIDPVILACLIPASPENGSGRTQGDR